MAEIYRGPRRIAHRGNGRRAPGNTLDAVIAAYECGCEGVEIDARVTSWKIRDCKWSELRELVIPYRHHLLPEFPSRGIQESEVNCAMHKMALELEPEFDDQRSTNPALLDELLFWQQANQAVFLSD